MPRGNRSTLILIAGILILFVYFCSLFQNTSDAEHEVEWSEPVVLTINDVLVDKVLFSITNRSDNMYGYYHYDLLRLSRNKYQIMKRRKDLRFADYTIFLHPHSVTDGGIPYEIFTDEVIEYGGGVRHPGAASFDI